MFTRRNDLEMKSVGTDHDADDPPTAELVAWSDV